MRIIITGASGRMGQMLIRTVTEAEGVQLVGATERQGSSAIGKNVADGVVIVDDLTQCAQADVLIDFTAPEACLSHARVVAAKSMAMVIGTTGFDASQQTELDEILKDTPTVVAANYSVGVNLALNLIQQAAEVLNADYDAEIYEAHHKHKVDAPSGTALAMGKAVAAGRGVKLDDVAVYSREGITGAREAGSIGFSVARGGNIVGDHKAMFIADEERIEINHFASDRMVFAKGAVRAAMWLCKQDAGRFDMQDVLGLK
ncbi:MAG TPA: 4-hydroxy-tetrahydrodipicolinate reductase [Mariprofundaceae bacterium]|nr:4-hydroxy-tetrahydrodipicolinate reductase [Mariprofundaceae bacterium]